MMTSTAPKIFTLKIKSVQQINLQIYDNVTKKIMYHIVCNNINQPNLNVRILQSRVATYLR